MINKRLILLVPESMKHIGKKVLMQWLSLVLSILFICNFAYLMQKISGNIVSSKDVVLFFLFSVLLALLRYLCSVFSLREGFFAAREIKNLLRERIYRKLLLMGEVGEAEMTTAEILQNAVEGVEQLESYFSAYLPQLFYSMLSALTLFFVTFKIQPAVAVLLLICVPLIPVSIMAVQKYSGRVARGYWGQYMKLSDYFLENLRGFVTLKIYGADGERHRQMNMEAERFREATMKMLMLQLRSIGVMDLIAYGGTGIGTVLAARSFSNAEIELAGAIMIILLCAEFFLPLRLLGSYFHVAMNGMAAAEKIFNLLDKETREEGKLICSSFVLSAQGLSYSYSEDKRALKDLSVDIPRGSFVAFVGRSGCGKSTAARLLAGQLRGYQGSVGIGGVEIGKLKRSFVREKITLIGMSNYIFKGSVRDNLKIADRKASDEEMREALKKVRLYELSENLERELTEGGGNLSGGQRQRLAVARALLHKSEIYIFDEATSNIDVESEEAILSVLHEIAEEKTVIFISHRLANVVKAGKIYVLEEGCLVEEGSHTELLEADGLYKRLWEMQSDIERYRGSRV